MKARILLLPGDGVGPEVIAAGRRALETVAQLHGHEFGLVEGLVGNMALDAMGQALPADTLAACRVCDAALLGAVAGPAGGAAQIGLHELCRLCDLHSSLMPVRIHPALRPHSTMRPELLVGVDLLLVRDRASIGRWGRPAGAAAPPTGEETPADSQLLRVIRAAFRAAVRRRGRLSAVMPPEGRIGGSRWQMLVEQVATGYSGVTLEHLDLVGCEQRLQESPARLDVILACGPGFDPLQRRVADLAGSSGLLPSATLGDGTFGIYEPAHGAATAIAGGQRANPTGSLLSAALLLRHSLELEPEALSLEQAVHDTLAAGRHTADLAGDPAQTMTTGAFTDAVLARLNAGAARAGGRA